jgi:hypothetical protein
MSHDKPIRSPGGSYIWRHEAREREFETPAVATGTEEIEQHFARVFGEPENVFHEIVPDIVHIDVHIIPPRPERDHCVHSFASKIHYSNSRTEFTGDVG